MGSLGQAIDDLAARTAFSGVIRVDRVERTLHRSAHGLADRAHAIPNSLDTQFAVASGSKGLTALTVMSLVEEGLLGLETTARSLLGSDLPLIDDVVTVADLLGHRSGIGDYYDEGDIDDIVEHVLPVPVRELESTEAFLAVLDGHAPAFSPGERFAYNNGGYVVLALIAERVSGVPFNELVPRLVCEPAGMVDTAYLRTDELPGRAALGYLTATGRRTNVFHVPVLGGGDGGMYSTTADLLAFWRALFDGRIVPLERVEEMVRPRSTNPDGTARYGLGFWLHATGDVVWLTGYDPGISFCSTHDPATSTTATVISNTTEGAWPLVELLDHRLFD